MAWKEEYAAANWNESGWKAQSATWHGFLSCIKKYLTSILVVSKLSHGMRNLPRKSSFAFLVWSRLARRFFEIGGGTHVDKKFHLMFFVFIWDDVSPEAELRFEFSKFHVFGEFTLPFHLTKILIILVFIFWIWDFDHVFVEQSHKLWPLHRLFDFLQFLPRNVLHFQVWLLPWPLHFKLFKLNIN